MAILDNIILIVLVCIITGVTIPLIQILNLTVIEMKHDLWNRSIGKDKD